MVDCDVFLSSLREARIGFFTGVPDSLLKSVLAYISDHTTSQEHVIAANEGGAVGLAIGHYIATGTPALVYLQNSGLGNVINPLVSLASPEVYGVPTILMIGWRGQPGVKDEPQHVLQGRITEPSLDTVEVPHRILPSTNEAASATIKELIELAMQRRGPVAMVVPKGTFSGYSLTRAKHSDMLMSREEVIVSVAEQMQGSLFVATTGKPGRELFEHRSNSAQPHDTDFLSIGGMGHASQIALGIALARPNRRVVCIDGDGAMLMHMGSVAISGCSGARNFRHVLVNNGAHESVGGQPTVGTQVSFVEVAKACGYVHAENARTREELASAIARLRDADGPAFLEVQVRVGSRGDLGRPTLSPRERMAEFMKRVRE